MSKPPSANSATNNHHHHRHTKKTPFPPIIKPEDYAHSPIHHAVVLSDHATLTKLVSAVPRLSDPAQVSTEADSLAQEQLADKISAVLDRRDVPFRETPLHLSVKLNDLAAVKSLISAGADPSLHNSSGWNPFQEASISGSREISLALAHHHHRSTWSKYRRRLPRFVAALRRMRDFYMEISFHFESSVIPFVGKVLPSDTYKIWKRDGNIRADISLAGFDGLRLQRADQSVLFLGDGDEQNSVPWGSFIVVNHDKKKIFHGVESAWAEFTDSDAAGYASQMGVFRPGMDVSRAELIGRTNWRRQEKTEKVGEWKARVYEVNNVIYSFRSRKVVSSSNNNNNNDKNDKSCNDAVLDLELDEDDDGFLVAENPNFGFIDSSNSNNYRNSNGKEDKRRHSSFVKDDVGRRGDIVTVGRKSVDIIPSRRHSSFVKEDLGRGGDIVTVGRKSVDIIPSSSSGSRRNYGARSYNTNAAPLTKEDVFVRSLKPSVWLTEQFPLKTEELLPLLDILATKVKAVMRMRELLTSKFPPGTFPVKLAIPVVPTVRVVITFTKFVDLEPTEKFYTPFSSPIHLANGGGLAGILEEEEDKEESETHYSWLPSSSLSSSSSSSLSKSSAWLRRSSSSKSGGSKQQRQQPELETDPFAIPSGYKWVSRASTSTKKPR